MGETHILKTWPAYFQAVKRGEKTFEVRRDDRGFQKGDLLELREYDPVRFAAFSESHKYTGDHLTFRISYVLTGGQFGIEPGFVVLGLATPEPEGGAE